MATYRDEAVVLRTYQLGEADRIICLLTRAHGKVRAVAKGVRRTSSKFGSRLEPFSHVDIQFAEGRGSLEVVTQVETLHPSQLGLDYDRFTAGQVLVETAERLVAEDGVPALQQYRLLLGALLAMNRADMSPNAVVDSYLLRSLAIAGWAVVLESCSGCGSVDDVGWFNPQGGGTVCVRCRPPSSARVDQDSLRHLTALLTGDWETVSRTEPGVARRCHGLVVAFASWHMDRGLRSIPFLER
ncbi:DNA repair protein RecO [Tessaracoccus rhinocerotis]|uniref:DNA repair protein RecO n=1 Tax=Tessaracoccus rhinocerotis TaxID=1689449 RepID=A0A553K488_9ACTN|nr:DNA repair protein RecO [Tessaracoccus rhinocerotis]TRY19504.1 DNA repair protein RecO [Tessaracoccus rhinocerotis]